MKMDAFDWDNIFVEGDAKVSSDLGVLELEYATPAPSSELVGFCLREFLDADHGATSFVIDGLLPRGDVTLFAAKSGLGKTFLAIQAVLCVAAGRPFLGRSVVQGTAVGLFWEDPAAVLSARLKALLPALDLAPDDVAARIRLSTFDPRSPADQILWQAGGPTAAFVRLEEDLIAIGDATLVIIDTAKLVFRDPIIDTEAVRFFIAALRALAARHDVAVVLVTHVNREGHTSGTTEWENHARAVLRLRPYADRFLLEVVKTNYAAPISPLPLARGACGAWSLHAGPSQVALDGSRFAAKTAVERAREAFLAGLDAATIPLSNKPNSPKRNYAPKVIAAMLRTRQLRVDLSQLAQAMTELLAAGAVAEVPGPGKHRALVLARTPAPGPALPSSDSNSARFGPASATSSDGPKV